jgi:hypothetical protein
MFYCSVLWFSEFLRSVHLSTHDCVFFYILTYEYLIMLCALILKNPRKSNVENFMAMTKFLLIFTFSFIFLYLFSIPLGIFLCFPLLFITLISHLFYPPIFSLPQLTQCRFVPQDIHVTVTSLILSVLLVYYCSSHSYSQWRLSTRHESRL